MTISKEQFVSIGQSIYSTWLEDACELDRMTEGDRRRLFSFAAKVALEATEEFAKVFDGQEG